MNPLKLLTRPILYIPLLILSLSCVSGQSQNVKEYYVKNKSGNFNLYEFIFMPEELVNIVSDSIGKEVFIKKIKTIEKKLKKLSPDDAKETKIECSILYKKILELNPQKKMDSSKINFIKEYLKRFLVDSEVDQAFFEKRFSEEIRQDAMECDISESMLILFMFDPMLYVNARLKKNSYEKAKVHFPIICTIQSCDFPVFLKEKMKKSILNRIKGIDNKYINLIRKEVEESNPKFVCN